MKKIITLILLSFFTNSIFAQDYKKQAETNAKLEKIPQKDFEKYVQNQISILTKINSTLKTAQVLPSYTTDICDDGGFETKNLSTWGWKAAANFRTSSTAITFGSYPPISGSTSSFVSGSTSFLWEIVNSGNDPLYSGLQKVHSGSKALKLGGSSVNYSAESILKTVNITPSNSNLSFWYALVLQDPGHGGSNPFFGVRVHSGSSVSFIPILPIIGSMSTSPIISDTSSFWISSGQNRIRPWTCARVDLSAYIGKEITIELLVSDCAAGAHFGYAYIDDICLGCTGSDMGDASITGISKDCGKDASVNGSYTLPHSSSVTGTLNSLQAQLYQGGLPFGSPITISSTYINTGTKTFNFPMSLFGTVPLGNYDIVVKANFTFSGSTYSTTSPTTGFITGINNDWKSECPQTDLNCCKNTLQMVTASLVPPSYPYNEGTYSVEKYNITIPNNVPITEVKVNVTSFEWKSDKEDCKQCQIKPVNLGSLYGGISIGGTFVGPTSQPYGTGIGATSNNNELVFSFPSGKNFVVGDFMRLTYLLPPEKDLSCCQTKAKVCFKISWKDINCGYCEVFTCSDIDLKNPSELKAGFPLPDRLMLYLNSRNLFVTGHADGF